MSGKQNHSSKGFQGQVAKLLVVNVAPVHGQNIWEVVKNERKATYYETEVLEGTLESTLVWKVRELVVFGL